MVIEADSSPRPPGFFSKLPDGRWEFVVDHQLLSTFSSCETKFKWRHTLHYKQKGVDAFYAVAGQWWADVMSDYYELLAVQQAGGAALTKSDLIARAILRWDSYSMDMYAVGQWQKRFAELCGVKVRVPGTQQDFYTGVYGVVSDYYDYWYAVDSKMWKIVATEAGFGLDKDIRVGETDKVVVYYCGRPDTVAAEPKYMNLFPADNKFPTKIDVAHANASWKPNDQMVGYVFAVQELAKQKGYAQWNVNKCVINLAARSPQKPRFYRVEVPVYSDEIDEFKHRVISKCERIRHCIENNAWSTAHESVCNNFYNSPCTYKGICATRPTDRLYKIQSDYKIVEPWTPYIAKAKDAAKEAADAL